MRLGTPAGADRGAAAVEAGVITADERTLLQRASELADRVIRVDDFAQDLGAEEARPVIATPRPATIAHKAAA